MVFRGICIVVTTELISEVLCVPRVAHPDYPSHPCLTTISYDKLASLFYKKSMVWGDTLNFSTTEFVKGPRILNMVMTFVLTPQSHYNTIIEPHACFFLSLLEDIIDFPSHMIVSMIDIYRDTVTRDKLIFPSAITRILTHLHITIPSSPFFYSMGAISKESLQRSDAQLAARRPHVGPTPAQQEAATFRAAEDVAFASQPSSSYAPSSSSEVEASLAAIMDQIQHMLLILVVVLTIFLMRCVR